MSLAPATQGMTYANGYQFQLETDHPDVVGFPGRIPTRATFAMGRGHASTSQGPEGRVAQGTGCSPGSSRKSQKIDCPGAMAVARDDPSRISPSGRKNVCTRGIRHCPRGKTPLKPAARGDARHHHFRIATLDPIWQAPCKVTVRSRSAFASFPGGWFPGRLPVSTGSRRPDRSSPGHW